MSELSPDIAAAIEQGESLPLALLVEAIGSCADEQIPEILRRVAAATWEGRMNAVFRVARRRPAQLPAILPILAACDDSDTETIIATLVRLYPEHTSSGMAALAEVRSAAAAEAIVSICRSGSRHESAVESAVAALEKFPPHRAVPAMLEILDLADIGDENRTKLVSPLIATGMPEALDGLARTIWKRPELMAPVAQQIGLMGEMDLPEASREKADAVFSLVFSLGSYGLMRAARSCGDTFRRACEGAERHRILNVPFASIFNHFAEAQTKIRDGEQALRQHLG